MANPYSSEGHLTKPTPTLYELVVAGASQRANIRSAVNDLESQYANYSDTLGHLVRISASLPISYERLAVANEIGAKLKALCKDVQRMWDELTPTFNDLWDRIPTATHDLMSRGTPVIMLDSAGAGTFYLLTHADQALIVEKMRNGQDAENVLADEKRMLSITQLVRQPLVDECLQLFGVNLT